MTNTSNMTQGRRRCLRTILILGAGVLAGTGITREARAMKPKSKVVIVKTTDRVQGIRTAMGEFDLSDFKGKTVALKANYNSADPFPASTHRDALETMITTLKDAGAGTMTLPERSGMGDTDYVLSEMGAKDVCMQHDVEVVVMDDLGKDDYVEYKPKHSNWKLGFLLAKPFDTADKVVQTCCLKTHQYGGHFTLALKNAVGAVAKYNPESGYNYMRELHSSSKQRQMIAEISQAYRNDLIVMDALKAFVDGGPHAGREVEPGVIVVGTDPAAVDAVGVAILRMYGTTIEVSRGPVFDQEQIKRAGEIGVGCCGPDELEIVGLGDGADDFVNKVRKELA